MHMLYNTNPETRLKWTAFGVALAMHALALLVVFPERTMPEPTKDEGPTIVVRRYAPPPPPLRTAPPRRSPNTRKLPIPDPTPQAPEPVVEPAAPIPKEPVLAHELGILLAEPDSTQVPTSAIAVAGVAGVTLPELIRETKAEPEYPEAARIARQNGAVILQAVIGRDGEVSDLELLRCDMPNLGFEESAMVAVRQWHYQPATLEGRPVAVYLTVLVSFDLL